jgi:hypothetical protein
VVTMSLVLGFRIVCDGPDCENPTSPGEVCSTSLHSMKGWITREQDGAVHHFCENSCEIDWLSLMDPTEADGGEPKEPPEPPSLGQEFTIYRAEHRKAHLGARTAADPGSSSGS